MNDKVFLQGGFIVKVELFYVGSFGRRRSGKWNTHFRIYTSCYLPYLAIFES